MKRWCAQNQAAGLFFLVLAILCANGCTNGAPKPESGVVVKEADTEVTRATGSRISRRVLKGKAAGPVSDMSGTVVGAGAIARQQNDIAAQFPMGGK